MPLIEVNRRREGDEMVFDLKFVNPKLNEKAKKAEADRVQTVEVNGNVYDADRASRINFLALLATTRETTKWKLADNSIVEVSRADIATANELALDAFGVVIGILEDSEEPEEPDPDVEEVKPKRRARAKETK